MSRPETRRVYGATEESRFESVSVKVVTQERKCVGNYDEATTDLDTVRIGLRRARNTRNDTGVGPRRPVYVARGGRRDDADEDPVAKRSTGAAYTGDVFSPPGWGMRRPTG